MNERTREALIESAARREAREREACNRALSVLCASLLILIGAGIVFAVVANELGF